MRLGKTTQAVAALALAVGAGLATATPADALLATDYRCTTHSFPNQGINHGFTMVVCWQYTYRAQADGTGVYNESIHVDITQGCGDLGDSKTKDMRLRMVNPKTGAVVSSTNMSDMHDCTTTRDLELPGRDVGDTTASWNVTFNPDHGIVGGGLDSWATQFNDCLSLANPYSGPCRAV